MKELVINKERLALLSADKIAEIVQLCPFGAIEEENGSLDINSACKMCGICQKKESNIFELREQDTLKDVNSVDKNAWSGIAVYIEHNEGRIHPVSLELIGKAKQLAQGLEFPVYALLIAKNADSANELLHYGVDEVYVYASDKLDKFLIEPYTNVCEDFVNNIRPSSVLIGATQCGRSLAPRLAARLRTGLTADCTKLEVMDNTDLIQIRPAFGGNIMARINTTNHRPQLATVRHKVFDAPERLKEPVGRVTMRTVPGEKLLSRITVISETKKERVKSISDALVIIAVGRGIKSEKDMNMVFRLAELLDAEIAATRPVIEAGWVSPAKQIGLSGRTVKPKLIINLGVSGAVQFKAGMENSELIISINTDEHADIFDVSHYAVRGDLYEIVPMLINKIAAM